MLLWFALGEVVIYNRWDLPAGNVIRFTLSYSATTYLHLPIFFANDFLCFHPRAAIRSDCLLSAFESVVLTDFLCVDTSIFPFKDATVT